MIHPRQSGFGIVEVVVVLGMIGIVVVGIGKVLGAVNQASHSSQLRARAFGYIEEALELVNDNKNNFFACACVTEGCSSDTCTRGSDGQSCTLVGAYTSCWTPYPAGLVNETLFYLDKPASDWQLQPLSSGTTETVAADPLFERSITITNVNRDSNGDIVETGGTPDPNTKKVTVTVNWNDRGGPRSFTEALLLTAWENL
jgi:type II secretory pathway pseudopilin PulG